MIVTSDFVFISAESRTGSNGKTYHNVNVEDMEGALMRIGTDEEVLKKLTEKYKPYHGWFNVGTYNGNMYMRLTDAVPFEAKQTDAKQAAGK